MEPPVLTEGTQLLHYQLIAPLGSGGMGVVWRALDTRLGREVALKLLPYAAAEGEEQVQRLTREARLSSALNHPNIVTIHDINSLENLHFIAMEYIRGRSLREMLRERRLTTAEALRYGVQLAEALGAAHQAGIIHRDLKPGNIVITDRHLVKILDFGLAKNIGAPATCGADGDQTITTAGAVVGTIGYMPPEQMMGGEVTERSDVFALGVVLYEMLTGARPFAAPTREETASRMLQGDFPPLAAKCPLVPEPLCRIVERCLRSAPSERFANCAAVAEELKLLLAGEPLSFASGSAITVVDPNAAWIQNSESRSSVAPRSRRRVWLWAACIGAVLLLVGATVWWAMHRAATLPRGVAVLPFTAIDNSERSRAFGNGLVVSLASHLTSLSPFREAYWVVPPGDVMQAKTGSTREARQMFGVDLVISGSVETKDDRVRITAVLGDARTQRTLRTITVNEVTGESFALQDHLVEMVAQLLQVSVGNEARAAAHSASSSDQGAEDAYIRGRGHLLNGVNKTDEAIDEFLAAVRRDPKFVRAYAGLTEAYLDRFNHSRDPAWVEKARQSSYQALAINPQDYDARRAAASLASTQGRYEDAISTLRALTTERPEDADLWIRLGAVYQNEHSMDAAEKAYLKAVELRPAYVGCYLYLGSFYYRQAKLDKALAAFQRATALAPDNYRAWNNVAGVEAQLHRGNDAEASLRRSLAIRPNAGAYNNLATLLTMRGRYAEAVPMMEQAVAMRERNAIVLTGLTEIYSYVPELRAKVPAAARGAIESAEGALTVNAHDAYSRAFMAFNYAAIGEKAKALRELAQARRDAPKDSEVLFRAVLIYEMTGDRDRALEACDLLATTGSHLSDLGWRPELQSLRSDPRYKERSWQSKPSN